MLLFRIMSTEKMSGKQYVCLFTVVLFLCGQLIYCVHVLDSNHFKPCKEDLATSIKKFVRESAHVSYIDVNSEHQNQSKVVAEFTKQHTSLLIELTASKEFDFLIQYEITPQFYKYEYVCNRTADCFKFNHLLPVYKTMRLIVQTTPETFNVHGKYYLK